MTAEGGEGEGDGCGGSSSLCSQGSFFYGCFLRWRRGQIEGGKGLEKRDRDKEISRYRVKSEKECERMIAFMSIVIGAFL